MSDRKPLQNPTLHAIELMNLTHPPKSTPLVMEGAFLKQIKEECALQLSRQDKLIRKV